MATLSPFHDGERHVQQLAKESDFAQRNGTVITDTILPGAIPFIAQQAMLVVSSVDANGQVWSSVLIGKPGFIHASDPHNLILDRGNTFSNPQDCFWQNIRHNPNIGMLVIELSTRRRFRVNGSIELHDYKFLHIHVDEAYPNCPKYIQRRQAELTASPVRANQAAPATGTELLPEHLKLIHSADSLFVGSAVPQQYNSNTTYRADASHRGGNPGFIEHIDDNTLRIPDYKGNSMFNTLGNIHTYPKAGIVLIDFERGVLLQLSGDAKILWAQNDPDNQSGGTKRYWELKVSAWQESELPDSLSWQFFDYSPHNPRKTKVGSQVIEELTLKISQVEIKSPTITRYRLSATQGGILPAFEAGAHLPIEVKLASGEWVERHYSILSSPHDNRFYDIAVKRETAGRGGSLQLHKQLKINATLKAKAPRNAFPLSTIGKHTILVAGGIGITPIFSMLRILVEAQASFEIHYTANSQEELAFATEIFALAKQHAHFYCSHPNTHITELTVKNSRLNIERLMEKPDAGTHIYLCGPVRMIEAVRDAGNSQNWNTGQIHFESFGNNASSTDKAIKVTLQKSAQVIEVQAQQTILAALLDAKISVPFDCQRGECGMCASTIIEGEAEHRDVYLSKEERQQQMCVCVSRAKSTHITLDL